MSVLLGLLLRGVELWGGSASAHEYSHTHHHVQELHCAPPEFSTESTRIMLAGEAKALHTTKRSSGIDVSDPELAQAWANVRQDSEPQTDWCAFTYAEVRRN